MKNLRSFLLTLTLVTLATAPLCAMNESDAANFTDDATPEPTYLELLICVELNKDNPVEFVKYLQTFCKTFGTDIGAFLLRKCLDKFDITLHQMIDQDNRTPLHFAAHRGWLEVVKLLLSTASSYDDTNDFNNAYVLVCNQSIRGSTALHLAASRKCHAVVFELLKTSRNRYSSRCLINIADEKGNTAWDIADQVNNKDLRNIIRAYFNGNMNLQYLNYFLKKYCNNQL